MVDPRAVIEGGKDAKKDPPYGADVLRLWVSSVDYSNDVMVRLGGGRVGGLNALWPLWRMQPGEPGFTCLADATALRVPRRHPARP